MLGIKSALIIAGSDKRGTIYGLFHLSECMGVSPLVDWSEVNPKKVKEVILTPEDSIISRIPSVKYRGIFINDEWPAFGTWAIQKFGGFNAKMYEHVFELIPIGIDRRLLKSRETAEVIIKAQGSKVTIVVEAENYDISNLHQMTFLETQGYIAMEAEHYYKKYDLADVDFVKLDNYGRTKSAMKLMPNINNLSTKSDKPWLEYCFAAKNEGEYFVELYLAPSNTTYIDGKMNFGMQINGEEIKIKNAVCDNFTSLDFRCSEWVKAIIDNIRIYKDKIYCKKGINYLRIYGISSSFVLERIVLYSINGNVPKSYLGPVESFYCK